MVDLVGIYYLFMIGAIFFHIEQIILLILIHKDGAGYKFRFSKIKGHPNLNPIANTGMIALIMLLITLVIMMIVGILQDTIIKYMKSLDYNILVIISGYIGALFLIWHFIVGKKWNKKQWALLISSLVVLGIFFIINYLL